MLTLGKLLLTAWMLCILNVSKCLTQVSYSVMLWLKD